MLEWTVIARAAMARRAVVLGGMIPNPQFPNGKEQGFTKTQLGIFTLRVYSIGGYSTLRILLMCK